MSVINEVKEYFLKNKFNIKKVFIYQYFLDLFKDDLKAFYRKFSKEVKG
jgi:hypothetical protein